MPQAASQISDIASDAVRRYDDLKLEIAAIGQTAMLTCTKDKDEEGERAFQSGCRRGSLKITSISPLSVPSVAVRAA